MDNVNAVAYCAENFDYKSRISPFVYTPDGNQHWIEIMVDGSLKLCSDGPHPFFENSGPYTKTRRSKKN